MPVTQRENISHYYLVWVTVTTTTKFLPAHPFTEDHLGSQLPGDSNGVEDNGQPPPLIQRAAFPTDDHEKKKNQNQTSFTLPSKHLSKTSLLRIGQFWQAAISPEVGKTRWDGRKYHRCIGMRGSGIEETTAFLLMEKEDYFHHYHHHQGAGLSKTLPGSCNFPLSISVTSTRKTQGGEARYRKENLYIGPS